MNNIYWAHGLFHVPDLHGYINLLNYYFGYEKKNKKNHLYNLYSQILTGYCSDMYLFEQRIYLWIICFGRC